MSKTLHRGVFWGVPAVIVAGALIYAFRPQPIDVDLIAAVEGPMVATVSEEGETRIRDIFVLSAPVRGRMMRIEIEEGDAVIAGETVIAEIEPTDPAFLDIRSQAEAEAAVETAKAAVAFAEARLTEAMAERDFAAAEVARARRLRASGTVSERALDDAERLYSTREAAVESARAEVRMREAEQTAAEIRLLRPDEARLQAAGCPCIPIPAPVSGRVLRVLHESEGVVEAGYPLVEIGDPAELEIVVDFLSSDAVRIEPGQRAIIDDWGGDTPLNGTVSRIEPYGFTKVSALGIEEQRVNVRIDLTDPPDRWRRLAHGYQVEARVVLWEDDAALNVPLTALFRDGADWAVFRVEDDTARLTRVEVGHRSDVAAQILSGLSTGDQVIRYPNDHIADGSPVRPR